MPGRATAVKNGSELEATVADLGRELGLYDGEGSVLGDPGLRRLHSEL